MHADVRSQLPASPSETPRSRLTPYSAAPLAASVAESHEEIGTGDLVVGKCGSRGRGRDLDGEDAGRCGKADYKEIGNRRTVEDERRIGVGEKSGVGILGDGSFAALDGGVLDPSELEVRFEVA